MKKTKIRMHPRETLTKKARAAIELYVALRGEGRSGSTRLSALIGYALEAERMSRARLYATLAAKGYRWKASKWSKLQRKPAQAVTRQARQSARRVATADDTLPDDNDLLLELIRAGKVPIRAAKQF